MRLFIVILTSLGCFAVVGFVFWQEDLRYSLPTPRPADLIQLPVGSTWNYGAWGSALSLTTGADAPPVLFNFFNPACSCSRFNLDHLQELQTRFGERVRFVAVVQSTEAVEATEKRLKDLGLDMPYVLDQHGSIAAEVGVYATPQAVLVDPMARIQYRGNYNASRYCTDPQTEYVRIALEALLGSEPATVPETPAYGCELPSVVATNSLETKQ